MSVNYHKLVNVETPTKSNIKDIKDIKDIKTDNADKDAKINKCIEFNSPNVYSFCAYCLKTGPCEHWLYNTAKLDVHKLVKTTFSSSKETHTVTKINSIKCLLCNSVNYKTTERVNDLNNKTALIECTGCTNKLILSYINMPLYPKCRHCINGLARCIIICTNCYALKTYKYNRNSSYDPKNGTYQSTITGPVCQLCFGRFYKYSDQTLNEGCRLCINKYTNLSLWYYDSVYLNGSTHLDISRWSILSFAEENTISSFND